ncbi:MAG: GGDEF domain-containing protein [Phycisphaerae bacterium]|nr:GGDEF domain-containing protein [Phycisphaerae bacterium]
MLLLADKELTDQIASCPDIPAAEVVADPYDALEVMARRRFPLVVLSPTAAGAAGEGEFAALCRASRRLQRDARLVALCPPRLEAEVRALVGSTLDDYVIAPPSQADLRTLIGPQAAAPVPPTVQAPAARIAQPLSPEDLSRLVAATFSRSDLESALAQMLAAKVNCPLEWADEGSADAAAPVLLHLEGEPVRVLVATRAVNESPAVGAMLAALSAVLPALVQAARRTEALHHLAITDDLTGAYNRRYFYHATDQILRQAAANKHRVTLLLYDIDDFKGYNEQYGYAVGDEILRETAEMMRRIVREHDIVARIGGDEFAVLFWDRKQPRSPGSKPPDSALVLSRRFLAALKRHEFPSLGDKATGALTISGGLASFPADGKSCRELLRSANKALKAVKQSGKKGIRIVGPADEETPPAPTPPRPTRKNR